MKVHNLLVYIYGKQCHKFSIVEVYLSKQRHAFDSPFFVHFEM